MRSSSKDLGLGIVIIAFSTVTLVILAVFASNLFSGGFPDFFSGFTGGGTSEYIHISKIDNSSYPNGVPYINLTATDISVCPIFITSMNKLQSFSNGSISLEITSDQRNCIIQILTAHTPSSEPTYASIFRYEDNILYNIVFAVT